MCGDQNDAHAMYVHAHAMYVHAHAMYVHAHAMYVHAHVHVHVVPIIHVCTCMKGLTRFAKYMLLQG